jgi:hypothetical protein
MSAIKKRVAKLEEQVTSDELLLVLEHARQLHLKLGLLLEQAVLMRILDVRKRQQKRSRP